MNEKFKPVLGEAIKSLDDVKFPVMVSKKYDGIRCLFIEGKMYSRALKPIRNKQLQEKFQPVKDYTEFRPNIILDGELYSHELTFQEISSVVMSEDKEVPESVKFHMFDCFLQNDKDTTFESRYEEYSKNYMQYSSLVEIVKQRFMISKEEVINYFKEVLEDGFEGLIIRHPRGKYKFGRSTLKEGILLKMKPYHDYEGIITGIIERNENTIESEKNELGNSFKRKLKENMVGTGIAASFVCDYNGIEVRPTITGTEEFRRDIWNNQSKYIGRRIDFKAMDVGVKDKPRHPTFLRFRDDDK